MTEDTFTIEMDLQEGYQFRVDFQREGLTPLLMDEPPPLGDDRGPNAARVLAAAVGNCLSASALLCLRKSRIEVRGMRTRVTASLERNEAGRLRIAAMSVTIEPQVAEEDRPRMQRCLEIFEDHCIVTQSVRQGIDVTVTVEQPVAAGETASAKS